MTKKIMALLMAGVMLLTLVGCSGETKKDIAQGTTGGPHIRGIISSIEENQAGEASRILVKGGLDEDTSYNQAQISITEETSIVGEEDEILSVDDLWRGKTVEVWFEGDVAESDPVQVVGKEIKILDKKIEVALEFTPEPPMLLQEAAPTEDLEFKKTLDYTETFGDEVLIHLYRKIYDDEDEKVGIDWGEIRGFLEYKDSLYELSIVSDYGLKAFGIEFQDVTGDGEEEIIITGGMGATYVERKIIGRNHEGKWTLWLQGGTFDVIDLDGDGVEEWVATSRGSIPSFVWINSWNGDMFQQADVARNLGTFYAMLKRENNQWIIEAGGGRPGMTEEEMKKSVKDFIYRDGKLIEKTDAI